MRYFILFISFLMLTACSTNREEQDVFSPFYKAFQVLYTDYSLTVEEARKLPYATVRASFDGGSYALMPLGYLKTDEQKWYSKNRVGFTTENARITQIYNVDSEVSKIQQDAIWSKMNLTKLGLNQQLHMPVKIDFLSLRRIGVKASVTIKGEGYEHRPLYDFSARLFRISETVSIPSMNYSFTNYYWKDPATGFIWESIQKWGPDVPVIHYQVVKPWKEVKLPLS